MKFTIDTVQKTLTIHGSFKFEDLQDVRRGLSPNWLDYTINVEPVTYWTTYPASDPYRITVGSTGTITIADFTTTSSGQTKLNFEDN